MKINVLGTGYVGLVSGLCLASKGHQVRCFDLRNNIVDMLNAGKPHFYENGLQEILTECLKSKNFSAVLPNTKLLADADMILVAVGTPSNDGKIDLEQIRAAATMIGQAIKQANHFISVVIKSTVLPTTTDTFVKNILEQESGKKIGQFGLGMNPEFLREGAALEDFLIPDRIVFGYEDKKTLEYLHEVYKYWDCEKIEVNTRTAELIKYTNNFFLALQISASNEVANIAAATGGIDIAEVMNGVHLDKRWNPSINAVRTFPGILAYLKAGCGFGGSCFPKDVQALRTFAKNQGVQPRLLQSVLDVNELQAGQVTTILSQSLKSLNQKKCVVLGLAFKPETDDVRESASFKIIRDLSKAGVLLSAHDPVAMEAFKQQLPDVSVNYVSNWQECVSSADFVVVATAWKEYEVLKVLPLKIIFDARRMFNSTDFPDAKYLTIGCVPLDNKASNA